MEISFECLSRSLKIFLCIKEDISVIVSNRIISYIDPTKPIYICDRVILLPLDAV
jgi:hypothetical protein